MAGSFPCWRTIGAILLLSAYFTTVSCVAVVNIGSKTTYAAIFEQFVAKNKPFVSTITQLDETGEKLSTTDFSRCQRLWECGVNITLPRIAVNNYLRPGRLQLSVVTTPYFENWPVALPVSAEGPSPLTHCPVEMHLVAWPLRDKDSNIDVDIFPLSEPESVTDEAVSTENNTAEDTVEDMDEVAVKLVTVPDDQVRGAAGHTASLPSRNTYIFVPRGHAARFRCSALTEDCVVAALCMVDASNLNPFRAALARRANRSEHAAVLHAAISSSSFSITQERSPVEVNLYAYATAAARADRPDPEEGGSGEAGMPNQPSNVADSGAGRRNRRKRGNDFKDWQAQSKWNMLITALTLPTPSAPSVVSTRRDRVEVILRSDFVPTAGDKTRFGFLVTACPLNATAESGGSRRCVDNLVLRGDRDRTGSDEAARLQEELDPDVLRRTGAETLRYRATVDGLLPDTEYELRAALQYDQAQSSLSQPSAACRTARLTPPKWLEGEGESGALAVIASEEPAYDAHTGEGRTRLAGLLHFPWPADDGGSPIIGFHVYLRSVGAKRTGTSADVDCDSGGLESAPWLWEGAHSASPPQTDNKGVIHLRSLLPSRCYQFRIAAFTSLGSSALSSASRPVQFAVSGPLIAHGWGHKNFLGSLTSDFLEQHMDQLPASEREAHHAQAGSELRAHDFTMAAAGCPADLVMLWTNKETLVSTCTERKGRFELWRSHWSNPNISVHARAAFVDADVSRTTTMQPASHSALRGRIVFAPRGSIPFTDKAMRAQQFGALALVVVDDGQCVRYDQRCLPGADKSAGEGYAVEDIPAKWERVHIPVMFMLRELYDRWREETGTVWSSGELQFQNSAAKQEL